MNRDFVIPDTQVRPGVPTDHIGWVGQALVDYRPTGIRVMGDWWDMHSLSTHSPPGAADMEGARYVDCVGVGNEAFERLIAPTRAEQARLRRNKEKQWNPEEDFFFGNHEDRISRAIAREPRNAGAYSLDHLLTPGFNRHAFNERVWRNGILYSHYFQSSHSHHAIGGTIDNRLNKIGASFVQGHEQGFRYGTRIQGSGATWHGLVAGSCYLHREGYRGNQGQRHWRGVVVLNEVKDGDYCVMPLTLDYLCRKYEGVSLIDYMTKKYRGEDWSHLA